MTGRLLAGMTGMHDLKITNLNDAHTALVAQTRNNLGRLLVTAALRRGIKQELLLGLSDAEALAMVLEELEAELPLLLQWIADDLLDREPSGLPNRAPDEDNSLFRLWHPRLRISR